MPSRLAATGRATPSCSLVEFRPTLAAVSYTVRIDKDCCISSGKCVSDAPDAFGFDDEELADVLPGTSELTDEKLIRLARQCPGRAILLTDADGNDVAF